MCFILVDPTRLRETGSVEQSVAMRISSLIQGRESDLAGLSVRDATRLVNHNIVDPSHFIRQRRIIESSGTDKTHGEGYMKRHYCAGCGRRFTSNSSCRTCGIDFTIASIYEGIVNGWLALPPKIVAYAKRYGIRFVHEPPRA
jgi:hypothetical protein